MTESKLDRLERAADGATPGPWEAVMSDEPPNMNVYGAGEDEVGPDLDYVNGPDATFISLCDPDTIKALVRVVRALDELKRTVGCPLCIDGAGEFAHSKDCPLTYFEEARDE